MQVLIYYSKNRQWQTNNAMIYTHEYIFPLAIQIFQLNLPLLLQVYYDIENYEQNLTKIQYSLPHKLRDPLY